MQGFFDNLDGFGRGDAESPDKFGFEPGFVHRCGDSFSATVNDDGANSGILEKNDIPHDFTD